MVCVCIFQATNCHYLVTSDQGPDGIKLELMEQDKLRKLTSPQQDNQKVSLVVHPGQGASPFDAQMIPAAYAERVAVGATGDDPQPVASCASFLDIHAPQRVKCSVQVGPGLKAVGFEDRVVCYTKCSKKRFKSTVDYQPKYKARAFAETRYVLPQRMDTTYVSLLDYGDGGPAGPRRWYTSTVTLVPRTYSHNTVHNFQVRDPHASDMDSEVSESEGEECSDLCASDDMDMVSPTSNGHTDIHMDHHGEFDTDEVELGRMGVKDVMMADHNVVIADNDTDHMAGFESFQNAGRMADSGYYGSVAPSMEMPNGYSLSEEEEETVDEL